MEAFQTASRAEVIQELRTGSLKDELEQRLESLAETSASPELLARMANEYGTFSVRTNSDPDFVDLQEAQIVVPPGQITLGALKGGGSSSSEKSSCCSDIADVPKEYAAHLSG